MKLFRAILLAGIAALFLGGWQLQSASLTSPVLAQDTIDITPTPEEEYHRTSQITVSFTRYRWWVIRYSNNWIECSFQVEHEGVPTADEIAGNCTEDLYDEWVEAGPCDLAKYADYPQCPGFYLQHIKAEPGERQIEIELPLPSAWISIANCNPEPDTQRCTTLPGLRLSAEEPLPNETIINIQGMMNGTAFSCPGAECILPVPPTGDDGVQIEFWADSSFGDSTEQYDARVRMIPWGEFMNPESQSNDPSRWYIDILSDRVRDIQLATCSETWQVFPSLGGPPEWLSSPTQPVDLQSDISFYYLAGALITNGIADASQCLDGGLQAPNIASTCGVEAARPQLLEWQNRFDDEILRVASESGVPARLLKNVFSRESQIWPGIYKNYHEAGLGQLTDNGADTILLWNPDFFVQFCPFVLDKSYCELGWGNLGEFEQTLLRGALVTKVNASCPDCPAGIDLTDADYSVQVFAEGMLANCEQVGRIITNLTGANPGQVSSYEDLWRYTLVNYNAGAGCLSDAIEAAWQIDQSLDWTTVTSYLEPACQGAIGYVEDISRSLKPTPTPTTWLPFDGNISTPILPRVLATPTPSTTEEATPTEVSDESTDIPTDEATPSPTVDLTQTPYP